VGHYSGGGDGNAGGDGLLYDFIVFEDISVVAGYLSELQ
jgi:hypothetical protein